MKKVVLVLSALALFGILISCKQEPKLEKAKTTEPETSTVEVKIQELEPDNSFYRAEVAYIDQDFGKSSREILDGVAYIKKLLPFAKGEQKKELQKSIKQLTEFAANVRADKVDGYEDFGYFFSQTGKALSAHHLILSETIAGTGTNDKEAAENLLKSIHFLRMAYAKSFEGISKEEQQNLQEYKEFAKKIIRKEEVNDVKKTFDNAFKNISGQILILGN
ncbi:MAG: hypothetical protein GXO89_00340 [Chlorobi bacterium]|nr:hypothetical protein [Chlorobiota bacterium]